MKKRPATNRNYPRTARVNELLREILAEELEKMDDERLQLLTITDVVCDADLARAKVFYDSIEGVEGDEVILEALGDVRYRLQAAINSQTKLRRTPELLFQPDEAVRAAARIEDVLRSIEPIKPADPAVDDEG